MRNLGYRTTEIFFLIWAVEPNHIICDSHDYGILMSKCTISARPQDSSGCLLLEQSLVC